MESRKGSEGALSSGVPQPRERDDARPKGVDEGEVAAESEKCRLGRVDEEGRSEVACGENGEDGEEGEREERKTWDRSVCHEGGEMEERMECDRSQCDKDGKEGEREKGTKNDCDKCDKDGKEGEMEKVAKNDCDKCDKDGKSPKRTKNDCNQCDKDGKIPKMTKNDCNQCDKDRKSPKSTRYDCNQCDKDGKSPKSTRYDCNLCGHRPKTSPSPRDRPKTRAKRTHVCGRTSGQSGHLADHVRTHRGEERPFECELCDSAFAASSALKSDARTHGTETKDPDTTTPPPTGDEPPPHLHDCPECGDRFLTAARLGRHRRIHTGERPFQCEECGVSFREATTLRAHGGTHLPRGPFACDACGEVFPRLNSLSLHKKVHNTDGSYRYVPRKRDSLRGAVGGDGTDCNRNTAPVSTPNPRKLQNLQPGNDDAGPPSRLLRGDKSDESFTSGRTDCNRNAAPVSTPARRRVQQETSGFEPANTPHPDVVRDALATGTVLESQGEDGQGYLIVLPRALAERDYTLITLPAMPEVREPTAPQEESSSCDLLVWDNELEVAFEAEGECTPSGGEGQGSGRDAAPQGAPRAKRGQKKKARDKKVRVARSYECRHCGRDCRTSSNHIIHMRTHTGERPYYCDYCGLGFKQLAHLKAHVRIHTGEHPYKCDACDAAFKQSSRLRSHQRTQHAEGRPKRAKKKKRVEGFSVRNFYCKICDRTFLDSCYKKQHMRTHADDDKARQGGCDARFRTREGLRRHLSLHADDSGGVCETCGLRFGSAKGLIAHKQASHRADQETGVGGSSKRRRKDTSPDAESADGRDTGQGAPVLYRCNVCKKPFRQNSNLKTHMRMHTDERPYKCNDCDRAFRQISHLKDHVKMHTGERPFRCSGCSAAFTQSSGVKYHIRKYHGGRAHVVKEQKAALLKDRESITVEGAAVRKGGDDTVVISIHNGASVSVERRHFGDDRGLKSEEEPPANCTENLSGSLKGGWGSPQKKTGTRCEACDGWITRLSVSNGLHGIGSLCENCEALRKSTPAVCKEEPNEDGVTSRGTSNKEGVETNEKNSTNAHQTYRKRNEHEGALSELDKKRNLRQYGEGTRNTCDMCGKTFGRASALRFHKKMSHTHSLDEEEEDAQTNQKGDCNRTHWIRESTSLAGQTPKVKEEVKDVADCEIAYCKCSFCGEKLPDLQGLSDHVSALHPKEVFSEDRSETCHTATKRRAVRKKRKRVAGDCDAGSKSRSVDKIISENLEKEEDLVVHVNSLYKCQGCEKAFTREAKLKDHINSWCRAKRNLKDFL